MCPRLRSLGRRSGMAHTRSLCFPSSFTVLACGVKGVHAIAEGITPLAAELVRRRVAVIITPGSRPASQAAKAATTTIPIVFSFGTDPVQTGVVRKS